MLKASAELATCYSKRVETRLDLLMWVLLVCVPGVAHATGLGEILHRVELSAPRLHAAEAQSDIAAAAVRVAKSQYWGHAELVGHESRFDSDRLVNPIAYPPVLARSLFDSKVYGYGAIFTLPLDIDGRISARVHAEEHIRQASVEGVQQTRLSLFGQAVNLYRGLQQLMGIRQALNEQLKALQGHAKVTAASVRVGRVAAVELLRIHAEIKSVEGRIAGLTGDEAGIRARLAALLNMPEYTSQVDVLVGFPTKIRTGERLDDVLRKRPDIRAADSFTRARDENLKSTRHEWLPRLSLQAETRWNQGYTAKGRNTWSITGQLAWQFWDGGRRFAQTDQAHANSDLARQQYQSIINQARAELQSADSGWKSAAMQYQATTSGLKAALETERIQSDRFENGRISAVDLIDAEASLALIRGDHISALARWWLADDQLHLARGEVPTAYKNEGNADVNR